ncbi:hypothetical protein QL285_008054 [Trifolium repens]|nr:hypothetical protein QL285_008054 [Trifolium repens]
MNGIFPSLQFKNFEATHINESSNLTPKSLLLAKFTFNPDINSNHLRITFTHHKFSTHASPTKRVSSAYCRCDTATPEFFITKGLKKPRATALFIRSPSPSTTKRKRKSANGSPCFKPLAIFTSLVGLPLTSTERLPAQTHAFIQSIHLSVNPNLFIIYTKNFQLTESYAFLKSTLKIIHFTFVRFAKSTTSLITSTPSTSKRPFMNADWFLDISLSITNPSPDLIIIIRSCF